MCMTSEISTAGAYVLYNGLFIFQVGPTKSGDKLGVVRLGGHREDGETALDTAKREAYEEAQIEINPHHPDSTFYIEDWNDEPIKVKIEDPNAPILMKGNEKSSYTVMYLSSTYNQPSPSSESQGLLLLSPEKVHLVCQKDISLNEYHELGGISILKSEINADLILQPFPQLLFLSRLLKEESELMEGLILSSLSHKSEFYMEKNHKDTQ